MADTTSPSRRILVYTVLLCLSVLAWALFSRLDILVIAQGKLISQQAPLVIQVPPATTPLLVATVSVHNDQAVVKGQPLLTFDVQALQAEQASISTQIQLLEQDTRRLQAQTEGHPASPSAQLQVEQQSLAALKAEGTSKLESLRAQLSASQQEERRLSDLLALAVQKEQQQQQLASEGFASQATVQDARAQQLSYAGQLKAQQAKTAAIAQDQLSTAANIQRAPLDIKKNQFGQLTQSLYTLESLKAQHAKNEVVLNQATIQAPFDGFLQGWSVSTSGQVLPAAAPLGKLVPKPKSLSDILVEAWVPAEDAAQLLLAMPVRVKLNALPFQKHGWLQGSLSSIAFDSQTPDNPITPSQTRPNAPLLYRVTVALDSRQPYWHPQPLHPSSALDLLRIGSSTQVDIQLGSRSPFDYFAQNLQKITHTALTER